MSIELLAPAGSVESLDAAIGEGADAVYLGLKDFNARLRSANFTYAQFESALRSLRRMGKKVYVTVNTVFEQREADRMYQMLKYLSSQGPDAIIVQDFGVVAMVRSHFPSLRLHASTQMNIASARGANALSRHGVSRVVLARELSLEELRNIKSETNLELEVFVHGALCVSVSGLCLFSSFLGGKSANRGMCTQACRRLYSSSGNSEGKGYYFSPNDLQLLERVPDLAAAGITAIKIEGRMKSAAYVGAVVSAYRLVLDAVESGGEDEIRRGIEQGYEILKNDFARAKTQYLFGGLHAENEQIHGDESEAESKNKSGCFDWLNPRQDGGTGINLGTVLKVKGSGSERRALISPPRGITLCAGDSVRMHSADDSARVSHKLDFAEKVKSGSFAGSFWISAPECSTGDSVYLIQTKEMGKRYAHVIANVQGGKGPSREKAPFPQIETKKKTETKFKKDEPFPEGLYAAVSRPQDMYIVQSSRPRKVMLSFSKKNAKYLLADDKPPLPFKPSEIILLLDPWFPQSAAGNETENIEKDIEQLTAKGYLNYTLNNPGHFSLFRDHGKARLIAGPWLYIFNSWSLSFISSLTAAGSRGVDAFISPLENNRQNLERTLGVKSKSGDEEKSRRGRKDRVQISSALHSKFFITVFAWPPLFNIRADLGRVYDFNAFSDNRGESFRFAADTEGARVIPQKYFSIVDKIPYLKEAGFGRFIVDLRGPALKKSNYRDLMRTVSAESGNIQPLPNSGRFNWKDGFYSGL